MIVDSEARQERSLSPRGHVASPPPPRAAAPTPTPVRDPPQQPLSQPPTQQEPPRPASPRPGPSSAPDLPETQPQVLSSSPKDQELGDDILLMLGDAPKPELALGDSIHKDVASRWHEILLKGLQKEVKEKLFQEYLVPSNCDLLVAPTLNAEAKAALTDNLIKRDHAIMEKQKQLGIALSALAQAMDLLLKPDASAQNILKPEAEQARCRALPTVAALQPPERRPRPAPPELAAPPQLPELQEIAEHEVSQTIPYACMHGDA
ncbi:proline-rich protein 12-like [Cydia pomonella]|uniref:proline-rich protein 12-like n=1 Tax=Cydia pomonella TaxID=82600 RepID=UPI002ADE5499|nr:proline-rich protein 12-like [Cydia pomonella]